MNSFVSLISSESLYKFLTILGLALFLSPSLVDEKYMELEIELAESTKEIKIATKKMRNVSARYNEELIEINSFSSDVDKDIPLFEELVNALKIAPEEVDISRIEKKDFSERRESNQDSALSILNKLEDKYSRTMPNELNKMRETISKLEKEHNELDLLNEEFEYQIKIMKIKDKYLRRALIIDVFSRIIGISMCFIGFILWYFKAEQKSKLRNRLYKRYHHKE